MQSREEAAREYLNSHKIRQVFQDLTTALVVYKPEQPLHFLAHILLQAAQADNSKPDDLAALEKVLRTEEEKRGLAQTYSLNAWTTTPRTRPQTSPAPHIINKVPSKPQVKQSKIPITQVEKRSNAPREEFKSPNDLPVKPATAAPTTTQAKQYHQGPTKPSSVPNILRPTTSPAAAMVSPMNSAVEEEDQGQEEKDLVVDEMYVAPLRNMWKMEEQELQNDDEDYLMNRLTTPRTSSMMDEMAPQSAVKAKSPAYRNGPACSSSPSKKPGRAQPATGFDKRKALFDDDEQQGEDNRWLDEELSKSQNAPEWDSDED